MLASANAPSLIWRKEHTGHEWLELSDGERCAHRGATERGLASLGAVGAEPRCPAWSSTAELWLNFGLQGLKPPPKSSQDHKAGNV